MYIAVKSLPSVLQLVLKNCGYAKKDIEVYIKESESIFFGGGDGYKGFAVLVNMSTGETKRFDGSWGGSNMFSPNNVVDTLDKNHVIPENGAIIRGFTGGSSGITHCTITIQPKNVVAGLLADKPELTEVEAKILGIMSAYKPAYRKPYLAGNESVIESLIARGFIVRNKAGSLSLSTQGKNAAPKRY